MSKFDKNTNWILQYIVPLLSNLVKKFYFCLCNAKITEAAASWGILLLSWVATLRGETREGIMAIRVVTPLIGILLILHKNLHFAFMFGELKPHFKVSLLVRAIPSNLQAGRNVLQYSLNLRDSSPSLVQSSNKKSLYSYACSIYLYARSTTSVSFWMPNLAQIIASSRLLCLISQEFH